MSNENNYEINETTFDVYVFRSVGFRVCRIGIFGKEYPDSALRRIFYPTKEFRIPRGVSAIC